MSDTKDPVLSGPQAPDPAGLRFLRILVTVLAGTMIAGLLAIIALLVIRLPATLPPRPALPAGITLPDGARPEAVTLGRGWVAVVTDRDEIVILDAETGEVRQRVKVGP